MAHLYHKIDIVNLMSHLDPDSPWGNTRQTRERYLHSMWESEFQLNELASILKELQTKWKRGKSLRPFDPYRPSWRLQTLKNQ